MTDNPHPPPQTQTAQEQEARLREIREILAEVRESEIVHVRGDIRGIERLLELLDEQVPYLLALLERQQQEIEGLQVKSTQKENSEMSNNDWKLYHALRGVTEQFNEDFSVPNNDEVRDAVRRAKKVLGEVGYIPVPLKPTTEQATPFQEEAKGGED